MLYFLSSQGRNKRSSLIFFVSLVTESCRISQKFGYIGNYLYLYILKNIFFYKI